MSFTPRRLAAAFLLVLSTGAAACGGGGSGDGGGTTTPPPAAPVPDASQYQNPVLNADFPDPGVVRGADGAYYAYATQTPGLRIQVARSTDLATWGTPAEALPSKPVWASQSGNFWAPDVELRENGTYVMYFSAQIDPDKRPAPGVDFCVGMATATSPAGPFADVGHPVVCGPVASTIDPQGFDDPQTGKRYLLWGSAGYPIQMQELSPTDRSTFAAGSSAKAVVTTRPQPYERLVEGAWMTYHAPYYYLFYSGDNCCEQFGPVSYAVMVARSASPTGPFEFLRTSSDGPATPVLSGAGRFTGPGHNAVITVNGADWMVYHAIDTNNALIRGTNASRRALMIDKITYQANGWPVVGTAGVPTSTPQPKP